MEGFIEDYDLWCGSRRERIFNNLNEFCPEYKVKNPVIQQVYADLKNSTTDNAQKETLVLYANLALDICLALCDTFFVNGLKDGIKIGKLIDTI